MSAPDPREVWEALVALGCGPHGDLTDFRARCPGHDGDNPTSLHVWVREDGSVAIHCHAHGCSYEQILGPIGVPVSALFPDGPPRAPRWPRQATASERGRLTGDDLIVVETLAALRRLGECRRVEITTECPYCGEEYAKLVFDYSHAPFLYCRSGCDARMFAEGLQIRLAELDETADDLDAFNARWTTPEGGPA